MMKSSIICLLSKASKTKSWLWHRHLSHLNFGTINQLAKQGLVKGLPKLKYIKDHLCSACQMGKRKKEPIHTSLDQVKFLRTKDEAPEKIIKILKQAQVSLKATVRYPRLVQNQAASTSAKPPTKNDWDFPFQPMFDEYFKPPSVVSTTNSAATLPPPDTVTPPNRVAAEYGSESVTS
ncbi:retrovirus-related pol polyprotein from transposon TNT 1-94 [Tanacetum coccineum]